MNKDLSNRILQVLKYKNLSVNSASKVLGIPQRTLNRQVNENAKVGMELLYSVLDNFPEVSVPWLVMGRGDMLCDESSSSSSILNCVPYYSELPVAAGLKDTFDPSKEIPTGYISVPQCNAQFYFPVYGTSMEPEIHSGDIIGVNRVESMRDIDPDKIYMIVTNESRMIKRCYHDKDNSELLWCVSPNYPSFTINKNDVCAIFHVVNRIEQL